MKRVIITAVMVALAITFIFIHRGKVNELDSKVDESYPVIMTAIEQDDTETMRKQLDELKDAWDDVQNWVGLTVDAEILEDIEISLAQCEQYARIESKENFIGEFIMFNHLIKHLPYFENTSLESLL